MITAGEARKRSKAKYEQDIRAELDEIDKAILAAVDRCDMSVVIYHSIHGETEYHLRDLGYCVEQFSFPNKVVINISWVR